MTRRPPENENAQSRLTSTEAQPPRIAQRPKKPAAPNKHNQKWQTNRFRCSPRRSVGRQTSFGAVLAGALAMKRVSVQSALYQSRQMVDLLVFFVVKTTKKPAWPHRFEVWLVKTGDLSLNRLKSLHRNSFGCQAGRDYCTETCLAAIRATRQELIGRPERPCGYYDPPIHAACELFVAMLPRSRRRRH